MMDMKMYLRIVPVTWQQNVTILIARLITPVTSLNTSCSTTPGGRQEIYENIFVRTSCLLYALRASGMSLCGLLEKVVCRWSRLGDAIGPTLLGRWLKPSFMVACRDGSRAVDVADDPPGVVGHNFLPRCANTIIVVLLARSLRRADTAVNAVCPLNWRSSGG